jgi:hypothetical protein
MREAFRSMPAPKLAVVHDNREVASAERALGTPDVFYSTDHREMLKVYAGAASFVGSRIHGAIAAAVHGAPVDLVYPNAKAALLEQSARLLGAHAEGMAGRLAVHPLDGAASLAVGTPRPVDRRTIAGAISREYDRTRGLLARAPVLGKMMAGGAT